MSAPMRILSRKKWQNGVESGDCFNFNLNEGAGHENDCAKKNVCACNGFLIGSEWKEWKRVNGKRMERVNGKNGKMERKVNGKQNGKHGKQIGSEWKAKAEGRSIPSTREFPTPQWPFFSSVRRRTSACVCFARGWGRARCEHFLIYLTRGARRMGCDCSRGRWTRKQTRERSALFALCSACAWRKRAAASPLCSCALTSVRQGAGR